MEARDKEIERLNRLLDGGRPVEAVLREGKKDSSERVIAHLNVQVSPSGSQWMCKLRRKVLTSMIYFFVYSFILLIVSFVVLMHFSSIQSNSSSECINNNYYYFSMLASPIFKRAPLKIPRQSKGDFKSHENALWK